MRYDAPPSRDTIERFRSFDSLSSTLTMRSNTGGGGPSIDSKATVAPPPLEAIAKESLTAPPLAQPPSAQASISTVAAIAARDGIRIARNRVGKVSVIGPCDIVKMH